MTRANDQCLLVLKVKNVRCSIRATEHGLERMLQRKINQEMVINGIVSLGEEKLSQLKKEGKKTMIIDQKNKITIIIDFKKNIIKVVTVINNVNVLIKNDHNIERII